MHMHILSPSIMFSLTHIPSLLCVPLDDIVDDMKTDRKLREGGLILLDDSAVQGLWKA